MPMIWSSFNNAPRRVQAGGWARQVTSKDFAISETISGVNMRLDASGMGEMHWHQQAEWAFASNGTTRITILDDLGHPHFLRRLGPDGTDFILAFDEEAASEDNTVLITD